MLTSLTVKTSFNWVIVTYGLMFCVGMMMGYGPPVQTAIKVAVPIIKLCSGVSRYM